jgi:hypothetical protein
MFFSRLLSGTVRFHSTKTEQKSIAKQFGLLHNYNYRNGWRAHTVRGKKPGSTVAPVSIFGFGKSIGFHSYHGKNSSF